LELVSILWIPVSAKPFFFFYPCFVYKMPSKITGKNVSDSYLQNSYGLLEPIFYFLRFIILGPSWVFVKYGTKEIHKIDPRPTSTRRRWFRAPQDCPISPQVLAADFHLDSGGGEHSHQE
jgi:hypothetical protein